MTKWTFNHKSVAGSRRGGLRHLLLLLLRLFLPSSCENRKQTQLTLFSSGTTSRKQWNKHKFRLWKRRHFEETPRLPQRKTLVVSRVFILLLRHATVVNQREINRPPPQQVFMIRPSSLA